MGRRSLSGMRRQRPRLWARSLALLDPVLEHGCSMGLRKKGVDPMSAFVKRDRVRPAFGGNHLAGLPGRNVDDIDDTGITDGYIEVPQSMIQEHDIGRATQTESAEDLTRAGIE